MSHKIHASMILFTISSPQCLEKIRTLKIQDGKNLERIEKKAIRKLEKNEPLNWLEQIAMLCRYSKKNQEKYPSAVSNDFKREYDLATINFHDFTHELCQLSIEMFDEVLLFFHNRGFRYKDRETLDAWKQEYRDECLGKEYIQVETNIINGKVPREEAINMLEKGFNHSQSFPLIKALWV